MKTFQIVLIVVTLISCNSSQKKKMDKIENDSPVVFSKKHLVDSVLIARHNHVQTDILSKIVPNLKKSDAYDIQLAMMEKEIDAGAKIIGWKLGGTATKDASKFNPSYGYILDKNMINNGGTIPVNHFPSGSVVVEAEIGFIIKNDITNGVSSINELIRHLDYVVGAIEIAQATAIQLSKESSLDINYVIASGMGQVATIKGDVKVPIESFDFENEKAKCFINDSLVAEGESSNIFGSPLNALFEFVNMLPKKGKSLKAGDLIITGSIYTNPALKEIADIRVEFSTLGTISFKSK